MEKASNLLAILEELTQDAQNIDNTAIEEAEQKILQAKRVFVSGAGRSGFVARAFANRLMHIGFDVHFVGEPTTPAIRKGDVLMIGSGSATTKSMLMQAQTAKREEAEVVILTTNEEGDIAKLADTVILIPGNSSRSHTQSAVKAPSIQPNGNSFEQLCWLIYDGMAVDLIKAAGQKQEQMDRRHSNLE
ncbi:MAG: 6-phospho-3-hexuloisomerase [Lachnospiraceae bacterium]|nr:6-phospho-3-hexuloisomerase [Lachnospiraceae bacterium]